MLLIFYKKETSEACNPSIYKRICFSNFSPAKTPVLFDW